MTVLAIDVQKRGENDVGTAFPDGAYQPPQGFLTAPFAKRLLRRFGKAEIVDRATETLAEKVEVDAVGPARLLHLPASHHTERVPVFGTDSVLPAFTAICSHADDACAQPLRKIGQQAAAFVVGVRAGIHKAVHRLER